MGCWYRRRVVPYIGTWIETYLIVFIISIQMVVPYIGTWIETSGTTTTPASPTVVPYIGTWIETGFPFGVSIFDLCRTLYRYVD